MSQNNNHIGNSNFNKIFSIAVSLNVIYIVIELGAGLIISSMALIADAGHNLGDVLGLMLAWGASVLAKKAATNRRTYGFRKTTILAALLNAIILLIAVGAIAIESIRRILHPEPVGGTIIMVVAGAGIIINGVTALLFIKGREKDLNIRGAYLHMAADAAVSMAVLAGGIIISTTGFYLLDPILSLIIVVVITIGTWGLLRDSFHLSLDAVPRNINPEDVKKYLNSINGVEDVHDLHIWAMSTTETALTAHLVAPDVRESDKLLTEICSGLHKKFEIEHTTIQIEKNASQPVGSSCAKDNI